MALQGLKLPSLTYIESPRHSWNTATWAIPEGYLKRTRSPLWGQATFGCRSQALVLGGILTPKFLAVAIQEQGENFHASPLAIISAARVKMYSSSPHLVNSVGNQFLLKCTTPQASPPSPTRSWPSVDSLWARLNRVVVGAEW